MGVTVYAVYAARRMQTDSLARCVRDRRKRHRGNGFGPGNPLSDMPPQRRTGGAGGTRTPYLILAKDALSLMSYSPTSRGREARRLGCSRSSRVPPRRSASSIVRRGALERKGCSARIFPLARLPQGVCNVI